MRLITPATTRIPVPRFHTQLRPQPVGDLVEVGRLHCRNIVACEYPGCRPGHVSIDCRSQSAKRIKGTNRRVSVYADHELSALRAQACRTPRCNQCGCSQSPDCFRYEHPSTHSTSGTRPARYFVTLPLSVSNTSSNPVSVGGMGFTMR